MIDLRWPMCGRPVGAECDACSDAGKPCHHDSEPIEWTASVGYLVPLLACTCGRPGLATPLHLTPCQLRDGDHA